MVRTISTQEAQTRFSDLVGSVSSTKEAIIVEEAGSPVAVLISPEDFERFRRKRDNPWAVIDRIRDQNDDLDPDEVLSDVTEIVEEVRQELYEQRQRANQGSR